MVLSCSASMDAISKKDELYSNHERHFLRAWDAKLQLTLGDRFKIALETGFAGFSFLGDSFRIVSFIWNGERQVLLHENVNGFR